MHDDPPAGRQARESKDFRRQAHTLGAENAGGQEIPALKLRTPDVKGHNLGEGLQELPLIGVLKQRARRKGRSKRRK
jgi:hypothetical protein